MARKIKVQGRMTDKRKREKVRAREDQGKRVIGGSNERGSDVAKRRPGSRDKHEARVPKGINAQRAASTGSERADRAQRRDARI